MPGACARAMSVHRRRSGCRRLLRRFTPLGYRRRLAHPPSRPPRASEQLASSPASVAVKRGAPHGRARGTHHWHAGRKPGWLGRELSSTAWRWWDQRRMDGPPFFFNFSVLVFSLRSVLVQLSYTRIIRGLARSLPKFVTGVTALSFIYSSFFFCWIGLGTPRRSATSC